MNDAVNEANRAKRDQGLHTWTEHVLPRFKQQGFDERTIEAARNTFLGGFAAGWESAETYIASQMLAQTQAVGKKVN